MIWFIRTSRSYMSHLTTFQFLIRLPGALIRYGFFQLRDLLRVGTPRP